MMRKLLGVVDAKFLRFVIVGVINTVVGTCIMFGLYNLGGFNYWISSVANYTLTSILSFFLNKYFTFKNKERDIRQVFRFALNIAVCYLLAYGIAKPLTLMALSGMPKVIQENVAMFAGMCLFTGFNYLGQRFFAFREKKES